MRLRALDILLLLLTVIGGVLALSSSRRTSALRAEYDRIIHVAGDLEVKDPARLHIRAIDTGDPWHFAWRVYMLTSSFSSGGVLARQENVPPGQRLLLLRHQFMARSGTDFIVPNAPDDGILL